MDPHYIRNFCIIAHIDHGKSTLADRLLERTGALSHREMTAQVLDSMDLERERGITIKAKSIRLHYRARDGHEYRLNLIDTPGHVDFSYEVSRALSACEGALLVVDASQGVEAQTVANAFLASRHNLAIIPVINKIDLPAAQPDFAKEQIESVLAIPADEALLISAKSGLGVDEVLESIVKNVPPPVGSFEAPLRALIFDSWFDIYRGAVVLVRVMEGRITPRMKIRLCANNEVYEVETLGALTPKPVALEELAAGDVGFIVANIKRVADARMGDTVVEADRPAAPLPGFEAIKAMVFAGLFPVNASDYEVLRDALGKLQLNDAAFFTSQKILPHSASVSAAAFLAWSHMEIVQERLEREFNIDLITTAPSVRFRITNTANEVMEVDNPTKFPPPGSIKMIEEPILTAMIITSEDSVGGVLSLLRGKARHPEEIRISLAHVNHAHVRNAAQRNRSRFLRPSQERFARLRFARLPPFRLSRIRSRQARCARRRRTRLRAHHHLPSRPILRTRSRTRFAPSQTHSAPDVRDRHPGRHRQPHHRPRNHQRHSQERYRQMLRRRHQP